jgi:hypothetical protein
MRVEASDNVMGEDAVESWEGQLSHRHEAERSIPGFIESIVELSTTSAPTTEKLDLPPVDSLTKWGDFHCLA